MRSVGMLVLGLAIGVVGTVAAMGATKQEVPFPRLSMGLMRHHFQPLRQMAEGGKCDAPTIQRHLLGLQSLSREFDAFLPTGGDDDAFERHAAEFARRVDGAVAAAPADCAALGTATQNIGGGCKACHDEFRG